MNFYIKKYIKSIYNKKYIGIFGTGNKSSVAESLLEEIGIKDFVYFDNDEEKTKKGIWKSKRILTPSEITKNYFILISTVYFFEIEQQLKKAGLKEIKDYIVAIDIEYYNALLRYENAPKVPNISYHDLIVLEDNLKNFIDVEKINWFDENEFQTFEKELGFQLIYNKKYNKRYRRKIMEYFFVIKLLALNEWNSQDIYVDIGAAGSPFAKYLRENKNISAYALDLNKGIYDELFYYIQENSTKMHFKNNEISAISMQSSFEMFVGNADIDFIVEAARVLKRKGKVIISPLYIHKQYLSTVSPNYYHAGYADKDALECIRIDARGNIPLGRFYSIEELNKRIINTAKICGLFPKIYSLPQELVEKDDFVYLKFILCLEKE